MSPVCVPIVVSEADSCVALDQSGPDVLHRQDCRRLARLHLACIPASAMTQLGFGYTASFYRYVQRSSNELVFVHRESNEIQSACVLSVAAASLGRRLCRHTPLVLFLLGGWFNPRLRAAGQAILGSGECGATGYSQAPELIFIFTAVERRGAGFASALIERCEHYLSALGYDSYVARTAINVSPETLRFYRRHGFACSRRTGEGGQFYLLEKCLNTLKR